MSGRWNIVFVPGLGYQVDFISDDEDNPEDAARYDVVIVIDQVTPGVYLAKLINRSPINHEQALASGI